MQVTPNPGRTPLSAPVPARRWRVAARTVLPSLAAAAVTAVGFAAFTDEARNDDNRAAAASVSITEDVAASAPLFALENWQPGEDDTVSRCIAITNRGSIPLPLSVRLDGAPTGRLGEFVDVTIERGSRAAATDGASCSGFTAGGTVFEGELDDLPASAGDGVADGGAPLAVDAERAYRVTWHLQDDEDAEGQSVSGVDFLWETTSAD